MKKLDKEGKLALLESNNPSADVYRQLLESKKQ
jgi:hypothetical protein